jgi:hypothetical protein
MPYGTINADLMTTSDGVSSSGLYGFKNRLINSAMVIDQRNAGASVTPTDGQYTLDRWQANQSVASKYSVQQNAGAVTAPAGFTNYLGVTSLSAYSVVSSNYFTIQQSIEGYNIADLAWGTANAKTVTLSFQVYSSLTGTFGGSLSNSAQSRNYPFTYTISSANTWTSISVTIAGDTSGTWLTTNGIGIRLNIGLGVGPTYSGTAGAWTATAALSVTGATSVVGTNGATFYITGVQLEKGSTATSFDYRPYGTELALCQRYYIKYGPYASGHNKIGSGYISSSTTGVLAFSGPSMRSSPTVSFASVQISDASVNNVITSVAGTNALGCGINVEFTGSGGGLTLGRGAVGRLDVGGYIDMSAEL